MDSNQLFIRASVTSFPRNMFEKKNAFAQLMLIGNCTTQLLCDPYSTVLTKHCKLVLLSEVLSFATKEENSPLPPRRRNAPILCEHDQQLGYVYGRPFQSLIALHCVSYNIYPKYVYLCQKILHMLASGVYEHLFRRACIHASICVNACVHTST